MWNWTSGHKKSEAEWASRCFRWSRLPSTYRVRWGGAPAPLLSSGVSRMGGQHQNSDPHGAHRRVCVYPHPPSRSFSHCSRSDLRNTMDTVEVSWLVRSHTTLKHITPSLNTIEQFFGPVSVHGHNSKTWVCRKEEKKKKNWLQLAQPCKIPGCQQLSQIWWHSSPFRRIRVGCRQQCLV